MRVRRAEIVITERRARVVAEVELGKVAMQVLFLAMGWYPIGSWSEHAEGRLCPGQASEDRRIMTTCREQYKTMPDRVVKAQALPDVKERAERVENASDREKP